MADVKGAKILVVDDNEHVRELLQARLERRGYVVETAVNGKRGLEKLQTHPYDLVLLDIMMPEMNGYDVLAAVKADESLHDVPIVVLSALNDLNSIVKCVELGAEDYLFKPIKSSLLWARMEASLEKKFLHDQEQARMAELAVLQKIDQQLNASLDLGKASEITLTWAMRQTESLAGLVGVVQGDVVRRYAVENAVNLPDEIFPFGQFAGLGEVVKNGRLSQDPITDTPLHPEAMYRLLLPISREERVYAVLMLDTAVPFAEESLSFLKRLADHASIAINNASLYEEVQAANQAKSRFVSLVAHELKTPMTSMRAYTEIVSAGDVGEVNAQQTEFLQIAVANVDRMQHLVNELSDISRIETGQFYLEIGEVPLGRIIEEVLISLKEQIRRKGQILTVDVPDNLPMIRADLMRMVQVMTNLVSNASKYTAENGEILVKATLLPDGQYIEVVVQDTGIGIPKEEQVKVFTEFFRSSDRSVRAVTGTGLGLNITKRLVELQGGRIWFVSEYQKGSQFFFTIPTV